MKAGSWYLCVFVTTFIYFYIYAVNYVRGARLNPSRLETPDFHPPLNKNSYIKETVKSLYRQGRDVESQEREARQSTPVFPRLSMQYHNYTRYYHFHSVLT